MKPQKIYAQVLEQEALDQFNSAMSLDCVVQGALMPDAHAGYSLPIGAVVATDGMIFPAWVGYDIGCGMCAVNTGFTREQIEPFRDDIFSSIYRSIPTGFSHNTMDEEWDYSHLKMTDAMKSIFKRDGLKQLCSLGGGNHFIEIAHDESDMVWIVIHSGSRGIGHATATHYMKLASGDGKAREGHFGFSVESKEGRDYIMDMHFCLEFALENRKRMITRVLKEISHYVNGNKDVVLPEVINRNHNHAEEKNGVWIHRKGATHAERGMLGVIPGNMKDGSFIVEGLGNPDALCSSSHGAGRVMSRTKARNEITLDSFKESMYGITSKVQEDTKDESVFAYKNIFEVMDLQEDLVKVLHHLKPIINIKA